MYKRILTLALILTLVFGFTASRASADSVSEAGQRAASYLLMQREGNGSIGGFGFSAWALMGLRANGQNSSSTTQYLLNNLEDIESRSATDIERTALGLIAGGANPRAAAGKDLIALIKNKANNGQIGSTTLVNDDIFGVLVLLAAAEPVTDPVVSGSLNFIANSQRSDGSFSYQTSGGGDSNNTAVAIQALEYAKDKGWGGSYNRSAAISYLQSTQTDEGGFGFFPGEEADAGSTAWVSSAIIALGQDPQSWVKNGKTPFDFLIGLQKESGGVSSKAGGEPDLFSSSFAAIALARKALPVAAIILVPSPSPSPTPSPSPEPTLSPSPALTPTPSPTPSIATPSPGLSPSPTPGSPSPFISGPPSPILSPTPSLSPTPIISASPSPIPSVGSPSPVPTPTPSTASFAPLVTPSSQPAVLSAATVRTPVSPSPRPVAAPRPIVASLPKTISSTIYSQSESSPEPTVSNTASPSPSPSTSPTPATSPDEFIPTVKSAEAERQFNQQLLSGLLVFGGLILTSYGLITAYRKRQKINSKARF